MESKAGRSMIFTVIVSGSTPYHKTLATIESKGVSVRSHDTDNPFWMVGSGLEAYLCLGLT